MHILAQYPDIITLFDRQLSSQGHISIKHILCDSTWSLIPQTFSNNTIAMGKVEITVNCDSLVELLRHGSFG